MQPDENFPTPLQIKGSTNLQPRQFATPNEIHEWIEEQSKFYIELVNKQAGADQALAHVWNNINKTLSNPRNNINELINKTDATENQYSAFLKRYTDDFKNKGLIDVESSAGHFLKTLQSTDPTLAAQVAIVLSRLPLPLQQSNSSSWLEAGAIAVAWKRGWLDRQPAEEASLVDLKNAWQSQFEKIQSDLLAAQSTLDQQVTAIEQRATIADETLAELREGASNLRKELESKTNEAVAKGTAEIEAFKEAYNQALALRAPTQYWKDKQSRHLYPGRSIC